MASYLLRRLLLALPTLLVISLLCFGLNKCAPGDPVEEIFGVETYNTIVPTKQADQYRQNAALLGTDRAAFYFSLSAAAYPDTLWRILPLNRRKRLEDLIGQTGNWPAVQSYETSVNHLAAALEQLPPQTPKVGELYGEFATLTHTGYLPDVLQAVQRMQSLAPCDTSGYPVFCRALAECRERTEALNTQRSPGQLRRPALHWHGFDNQYHRWLTGFMTGKLGLTHRKIEVWKDLQSGLYATVTINGLAILLAYLIAIPMGVGMARRHQRAADRWGKRALIFVYSMPAFWLGGLLILLYNSSDWAKAIIPSLYFDVQDAWTPGVSTFGSWWAANASKCILPILILTLHALAVLALQMRGGMLSALRQDYIRTARAKGVPEEEVYWSHALRNALFPIITIFASVLPSVFAGSLVVEALFGFPGIGTKTLEAYMGKDLPLLSAIMMAAAVLSIIGNLIADVLYALADPRVRFGK